MLSADFLHLEEDVDFVNQYADVFHLDIMDGVFVPNLSYGFPVVEAIAKKAVKPLDVHLMIVEPEKYVDRFAKVGADMISFHLNATENPSAVLAQIRAAGAQAGAQGAGPNPQAGPAPEGFQGDDVVDGDYKEV